MGIAYSVLRGNLDVTGGHIVSKIRFNGSAINKRRVVLFFEDIISDYIKLCEDHNFADKIEGCAYLWSRTYIDIVTPGISKLLPKNILINTIFSSIWKKMGLLERIKMESNGDRIEILTKGEIVTRTKGKNAFCIGLYRGLLESIFMRKIEIFSVEQANDECRYTYIIFRKKHVKPMSGKDKETYRKLNSAYDENSFDLRKSIKTGMVLIKDNKILFRNRRLVVGEPTLLHILGKEGIMLKELSQISNKFMLQLIQKGAKKSGKLKLIRNILQLMGFGTIAIVYDKNKIHFKLNYPFYTLQKEDDNRNFIAYVILGFIRCIDERFRILSIKEKNIEVDMTFVK